MNNRDLEWMNKRVTDYLCDENSKYDDQGKVLEVNHENEWNTNHISVSYNGEDIETDNTLIHKGTENTTNHWQSLYKLYSNTMFDGSIHEYVELRQENYYNENNEINRSNFYQEGNDDYIERREYYDKEKYSKVQEFISDDNGFEVDEVRYWKKEDEKEQLDFGVIYNNGEYTINKFKNDALDYKVDLGTLVDEYDKNRKEDK